MRDRAAAHDLISDDRKEAPALLRSRKIGGSSLNRSAMQCARPMASRLATLIRSAPATACRWHFGRSCRSPLPMPWGLRLREASANERTPFPLRSEEHTSELHSLMRISYAVFCLKK